MSAIKERHHNLIERQSRYYDPEIITDIESLIAAKIKHGQDLAARLFDTYRQRLGGHYIPLQASEIRRQLEQIQDDIELELAILDRRSI